MPNRCQVRAFHRIGLTAHNNKVYDILDAPINQHNPIENNMLTLMRANVNASLANSMEILVSSFRILTSERILT